MRLGKSVHILALVLFLAGAVPPVFAADEATSWYNAGVADLERGNFEGAIASFDRALASDISTIKLSGTLLYTYQDKSYAQIQLQHYDAAIVTTDQGLSLYPEDKMLWNNRGYAYYNRERYEEALAAYNSALRFAPDYTIALINKGDTLSKREDYPGAVEAYTRALETDPGNMDATAGLASAHKAAAALVSAAARSAANKSRAMEFYQEGVHFSRLGQYTDAIASFDKAIALSPNTTGAEQDRESARENERLAQQTTALPVHQQTSATQLPLETRPTTRAALLTYAPAGALVLMAGVALWRRRQGPA